MKGFDMISANYNSPSFQGKFKDPNSVIDRAKFNSLMSAWVHSKKIKMPFSPIEKAGIKKYATRLKKVFVDFAQALPEDAQVVLKKEKEGKSPSLNLYLKDSVFGNLLLFKEKQAFWRPNNNKLSLSKFEEMFNGIKLKVGASFDEHRAEALKILTKNKLNKLIDSGKFSKEQAEKIAAKYNL